MRPRDKKLACFFLGGRGTIFDFFRGTIEDFQGTIWGTKTSNRRSFRNIYRISMILYSSESSRRDETIGEKIVEIR